MKYQNEIVINKPVEKVFELFANIANMQYWMPGFAGYEPVSGTAREEGAITHLKFRRGNRQMVIREAVIANNPPHELALQYEHPGVYNHLQNTFTDLGNGTTRYTTENEFMMTGFMKIVGWLMPGIFKKKTRQNLELFKKFVEKAG